MTWIPKRWKPKTWLNLYVSPVLAALSQWGNILLPPSRPPESYLHPLFSKVPNILPSYIHSLSFYLFNWVLENLVPPPLLPSDKPTPYTYKLGVSGEQSIFISPLFWSSILILQWSTVPLHDHPLLTPLPLPTHYSPFFTTHSPLLVIFTKVTLKSILTGVCQKQISTNKLALGCKHSGNHI